MQRLRSRISIVWLATAATLLPLVVMAALLLWMYSRSTQRTSESLGQQVIEASTQRVEEALTTTFDHTRGLSDSLSELIANRTIGVHDEPRWKARLLAHLRGNPDISAITFVDANNQCMYMARFVDSYEYAISRADEAVMDTYTMSIEGVIDPASKRTAPFDARTRPWYQLALLAPGPSWTPAYAWFTGEQHRPLREWGVGYTRMVLDTRGASSPATAPAGAPMLGVLCVDISLSQLSRFLSRVAAPLHATMFITDEDDRVLGASTGLASNSASRPSEIDAPLEKALARFTKSNSAATEANGHNTRTKTLVVGGQAYWVNEATLHASPTDRWRLTLAVPQQAVLGDVRAETWWVTCSSIAIVTIAAAIAVAFARQLSQPFQRLGMLAREVGNGQFEGRITIASSREVAQLAEALNTMASNLGERVALLAQKDAAESASALKARLIAHVSHEFRTPLNSIIGYAELLGEEASARSRPREAADAANILTASRHLLSLVENLLDLSTIDANRLRLYLCEFSIADLVADVASSSRPVVEKNHNTLHVVSPPPQVRMTSDPTRVRQVLINLVGNAGKYCTDGEVTLTAQAVDGTAPGIAPTAVFIVADTGPGIPPAILPRLFEPFASLAQGGHAGTGRGGVGLGLAITRQLCRSMGGDITFRTGPGGTRMTVTLPLVNPAEPAAKDRVELHPSPANSLG